MRSYIATVILVFYIYCPDLCIADISTDKSSYGNIRERNYQILSGKSHKGSSNLQTGNFRYAFHIDKPANENSWKFSIGTSGNLLEITNETSYSPDQIFLSPVLDSLYYEYFSSKESPIVTIDYVIVENPDAINLSTYDSSNEENAKPEFIQISKLKYGEYSFPHGNDALINASSNTLLIGVADLVTMQFATCTGFFITPRLIITNYHCIYPSDTKSRLWIWSNFLQNGNRLVAPLIHDPEVIYQGKYGVPDIAIIRSPEVYDLHITSICMNCVSHDRGLVIIQYPGSNTSIMANYDLDCKLLSDTITENSYLSSLVFFKHGCDTAAGSSGSPVFVNDLKSVIGVHYWGHKGNQSLGNRAVPFSEILMDIEENDVNLYNEIKSSIKEE